METTNPQEIKTIMHFHTMFKNFVKPQMEIRYAKENSGKKLGFHVVNKDGQEILFDDLIAENATIKGADGTK